MKTGFSTVACGALPYRDVLAAARRAGMAEVEIRLDNRNRPFGLSPAEVPALVAACREAGVTVSDLGSGITLTGDAPDKCREAETLFAAAQTLGARGVRVFLGNFSATRSGYDRGDYPGIVRSLRRMCDAADAFGVGVWVETHNAYSTGAVLKKLLTDTDRAALSVIWDVMHPYEMGESPTVTARCLAGHIAHVHIKDGVPKADPDAASFLYTRLGEGTVPVREVLAALAAVGYNGTLSLEWEAAWRPELAGIYPSLNDLLAAYTRYLSTLGIR